MIIWSVLNLSPFLLRVTLRIKRALITGCTSGGPVLHWCRDYQSGTIQSTRQIYWLWNGSVVDTFHDCLYGARCTVRADINQPTHVRFNLLWYGTLSSWFQFSLLICFVEGCEAAVNRPGDKWHSPKYTKHTFFNLFSSFWVVLIKIVASKTTSVIL